MASNITDAVRDNRIEVWVQSKSFSNVYDLEDFLSPYKRLLLSSYVLLPCRHTQTWLSIHFCLNFKRLTTITCFSQLSIDATMLEAVSLLLKFILSRLCFISAEALILAT